MANCEEDREHVFFDRLRFMHKRRNLEETLDEVLIPENMVRRMLASQENLDAIN